MSEASPTWKDLVTPEDIPEMLTWIFEHMGWLHAIESRCVYGRTHDNYVQPDDASNETQGGVAPDHSKPKQTVREGIRVMASPDGDVYVWIQSADSCPPRLVLRYRMSGLGGGASPCTRIALLILALAIKQDNEADAEQEGG